MQRITNHPILGPAKERKQIEILVDGKRITAYAGESIAAALLANGFKVFKLTARFHSPRTIFCGIGKCTDCTMVVNGQPNVRTCITRVEAGMIVETQIGNGK
ncbi:MAG: (2Fe-2S)-binding protein [Spirochaetota bacterium]